MSLPLNPQILAAAYEYLRATPPFKSWKLPPASAVKFKVTRHTDQEGDFTLDPNTNSHTYRVSANTIGHTNSLITVMAHEMVHGRQAVCKLPLNHNADFRRMSERVCRHHGWDVKIFVR